GPDAADGDEGAGGPEAVGPLGFFPPGVLVLDVGVLGGEVGQGGDDGAVGGNGGGGGAAAGAAGGGDVGGLGLEGVGLVAPALVLLVVDGAFHGDDVDGFVVGADLGGVDNDVLEVGVAAGDFLKGDLTFELRAAHGAEACARFGLAVHEGQE